MREYDPHDVTMGVDIGSNVDAPPMSDAPVTKPDTLTEQHTLESTPLEQNTLGYPHDVLDVERDPITDFEARFRGSSYVTCMGKHFWYMMTMSK